jgi:hypothetical protein
MITPYDKKDAAKETDSSSDEVKDAWHWARVDSGRESGYPVYLDFEDKTELYEDAKEALGDLSYIMDVEPDEDE